MSYSQLGTGGASLSNLLQPHVEALTGASGINEDQARICVLYALVTHIDNLLYGLKFIPPLAFIGKTATGKSELLKQMYYLLKDPKRATDATYATMRNEMENCRTYLIDEADKASEKLLLARSNKAKVSHMVTPQGWTPQVQDVSGATVLARRNPFTDSAVRNRSIVIHTNDNPGQYQVKPISGIDSIAKMIQPYQLQTSGRVLDVWQPLLQIAMAINDAQWITPIMDAVQKDNKILRSGQEYEPEQVILQALDKLTWDSGNRTRLNNDVDLAEITGEANDMGDVKLKKKQVEEILVSKGFNVTYTPGIKMVRSDTKLLDSLL